jgi:hypothetical protein
MKFRDLKEEEIEVRVSRVANAGVELLLYKDARVDQNILDETVGSENWMCNYYEHKNTLFCSVAIKVARGEGIFEWVSKDNAGAPSNMEAQKGEASDAFKRACFCWGIGRELYTAPRIFVYADKCDKIQQGKNGKMQCYDRFHVEKVRIEDGQITGISIWNDTTGHRCFVWQKGE